MVVVVVVVVSDGLPRTVFPWEVAVRRSAGLGPAAVHPS